MRQQRFYHVPHCSAFLMLVMGYTPYDKDE